MRGSRGWRGWVGASRKTLARRQTVCALRERPNAAALGVRTITERPWQALTAGRFASAAGGLVSECRHDQQESVARRREARSTDAAPTKPVAPLRDGDGDIPVHG